MVVTEKKHINLSLDPSVFLKLKERKEKAGSKTWEEFITSAILNLTDQDLDLIRLQQAKYELNYTFYFVQAVAPNNKYPLELTRIIALSLLSGDLNKAQAVAQQLLDYLTARRQQ